MSDAAQSGQATQFSQATQPGQASQVGQAQPRCMVLQVTSATPNPIALSAAVEVARALQLDLQSIFFEDENLTAAAGLSCAREFSSVDRGGAALSLERMQRELKFAAASVHRQVEQLSLVAKITTSFGVVRTQSGLALPSHCREARFVALAEPLRPSDAETMRALLGELHELGGFLFVGPHVRRLSGPIVVVAEAPHRLPQLLSHAQSLTNNSRRQIIILIAGERGVAADAIDAEARTLLGAEGARPLVIMEDARGEAAVLAQAVRRLKAGLVIGHMGELLTPGENELRALAAALESPMLLLR